MLRVFFDTLFAAVLVILPIGITIQRAEPAPVERAPRVQKLVTAPKKEGIMKGFVSNIERLTEENNNYRQVLYTGKNLQLVLMAILPGGEIGEEVHEDRDQFFRIETGEGEVLIDGNRSKLKSDDAIVVPAGARHNIVNTGNESLRFYTLYAPPEHRDGTVHVTKAAAEASQEHFDGKTTE
jgi:mannose-6-phosphate isomerase-like protein (cupin superfamily)